MNIQKWLTPLLQIGRKKRSSGKGMMWASIISVIVSFIALRGLKMGQTEAPKNPLKSLNIPNKVTDIQQFLNSNDRQVLAEISDEFMPGNLMIEHNQSKNTNIDHNHEI